MNFRRGSLTVELACLMPVILFVIFSLLGLCFYVHNRCFLSAGACEAALTGAMESHRQDGAPLEAARLRAKERASVGIFLGWMKSTCRFRRQEKNGKSHIREMFLPCLGD